MSGPRRPKVAQKKCAHCKRRRLRKFIEWHPGIGEWRCSSILDCDVAIAKRMGASNP